MNVTSARLADMFVAISQKMQQERDHLCKLDGVIGDADHGVTMALGFSKVEEALKALDLETVAPSEVLNVAAKSILNAVGASSGPLYATAFMRGGAAVKGQQVLGPAEVISMVKAMAQGIADRGKAAPGDKTMIDAWAPAAAALDRNEAASLGEALRAATEAASAGAEGTASMVAKLGRAARLGERAVGHVDPGAASAAMIIQVIADKLG